MWYDLQVDLRPFELSYYAYMHTEIYIHTNTYTDYACMHVDMSANTYIHTYSHMTCIKPSSALLTDYLYMHVVTQYTRT